MTSASILFIIISPYTAFLPMLFTALSVMKNKYPIFITPWNLGLFFLFSWSLIVGAINMNSVSTVASFAILLYLFLSVYFQIHYNEDLKIENLLKSVILFSSGSAVIGLLEKFTAYYFGSIHWGYIFGIPQKDLVSNGYRIYSTFGNPNVAGTWYAAMILICFYFFDNSKGIKKVLYGAGTALFTCVLILTGSRGAALGLTVGLISYGILRGIKKNIVYLLLILTFVIVLMLLPTEWLPWIHVQSSPMAHSLSKSVTSRQEIWEDSLKMFALKPITGWGLMGIYFASSDLFKFYIREPHAHNLWISIATTLGIVGLGAYIYIKVHIIKNILFLLNKGCRLAPLLAAIQAAVIGHGMVDFTVMTPQGGIIFFGCSALIFALSCSYCDSKIDSIHMLNINLAKNRAA